MIDHDIRSGWFITHWISSITRQTSNREPILILFTSCNTKIIKKHTQSQIVARSRSLFLALYLLFLLFVTDECECARSSRRWWWWCVRMKQFQVSKKQSEVANEQTSDEKEKKSILTDSDRITIIHTPKNMCISVVVVVSVCRVRCARLYTLLGSWLGPRAYRASLYHFMLFSIYFFFGRFVAGSVHERVYLPFRLCRCVRAHIRLYSYIFVFGECVPKQLLSLWSHQQQPVAIAYRNGFRCA